jgi:hypothetical protein
MRDMSEGDGLEVVKETREVTVDGGWWLFVRARRQPSRSRESTGNRGGPDAMLDWVGRLMGTDGGNGTLGISDGRIGGVTILWTCWYGRPFGISICWHSRDEDSRTQDVQCQTLSQRSARRNK